MSRAAANPDDETAESTQKRLPVDAICVSCKRVSVAWIAHASEDDSPTSFLTECVACGEETWHNVHEVLSGLLGGDDDE